MSNRSGILALAWCKKKKIRVFQGEFFWRFAISAPQKMQKIQTKCNKETFCQLQQQISPTNLGCTMVLQTKLQNSKSKYFGLSVIFQ